MADERRRCAGFYRVRRADATMLAVAAEIPPEESDLTPLAADVLQGRLAGGRDAALCRRAR